LRKPLASAFVLALIAVSLVSHNTNATSQDQPGVIRTSIQVTARTLNFYRSNSKMWSWVPEFKFSLTRARNSGDQHYVEYTIPGAGPALKFDCELNQRGDGLECGGRAIPEDKSATYTGPVNFAIKVRNELQGTDATLFTGKMKIARPARTQPAQLPRVSGSILLTTIGTCRLDISTLPKTPYTAGTTRRSTSRSGCAAIQTARNLTCSTRARKSAWLFRTACRWARESAGPWSRTNRHTDPTK